MHVIVCVSLCMCAYMCMCKMMYYLKGLIPLLMGMENDKDYADILALYHAKMQVLASTPK